jgi:tetratricopeptide (TPR) repeat protein
MLVHLGNIYQREDRLGDAEQAYRSALTIFRRLPLQAEEATVLLNLGVTYSRRGRYAEALETLDQALKLNEKSPTAADILGTQILNSMGLVYLRRGNRFSRP